MLFRSRNNSLRSLENIKIPDLKKFIDLNEQLSSVIGTYPNAKVIGVALNTIQMENNEALEIIKKVEENTGLPSTDVIRYGGAKIFDKFL